MELSGARLPGQRLGLGASPRSSSSSSSVPAPKTPFMLLHEHFPLVDRLLHITPVNGRFQASATIATKLFQGEGSTKKEAKQNMAERALLDLLPAMAASLSNYTPVIKKRNNKDNKDNMSDPFSDMLTALSLQFSQDTGIPHSPVILLDDISPPDAKLNHKLFRCTLTMAEQGVVFKQEGNSKKTCKSAVIKMALKQVFNVEDHLIDQKETSELKLKSDHPISMLCEAAMKCALKMEMNVGTSDGRPPEPSTRFTCIVNIENKGTFEAEGNSKKAAKILAAVKALSEAFGVVVDAGQVEAKQEPTKEEQIGGEKRKFRLEKIIKSPAEIVPPPQLLHQLCQIQGGDMKAVTYDFVEETKLGKSPLFVMKVTVGEREFVGQGFSKKLAKTQAAREALSALFLVPTPDPDVQRQSQTSKRNISKVATDCDDSTEVALTTETPSLKIRRFTIQTSADILCGLVRAKYLQLCTENGLTPTSYLAGFVLTQGPALSDGQVVALATGARAASYASVIGQKGLTLIDSHAEVLARRGLLLYLYQQLELLADPLSARISIFEAASSGRGYRLKNGCKLHFYSTLPPPGDARVRLGSSDEDNPDASLFRCYGAEEGGSSVPVGERPQQTWTTLRGGGEALAVMSVSDKMLKWNVLGLQGALLGHFLEPVHLADVVFGSEFDRAPAVRALYGRWTKLSSPEEATAAEATYPIVSGVTDPEQIYGRPRVPPFSAIWTKANPAVEQIIETGTDVTGKHSCLCKSVLFEHFGRLLSMKLRPIIQSDGPLSEYRTAKEASCVYQTAKKAFLQRTKEAGFGDWQLKPPELEQFRLSWAD